LISFGNEKTEFFFSPAGFKFYMLFGGNSQYFNGSYSDEVEFKFYIRPGLSTKLGLNLYLGKNNNVIFTPVYINFDVLFLILSYPIPQYGFGMALKFKTLKKI
jgi:hypothetical protein